MYCSRCSKNTGHRQKTRDRGWNDHPLPIAHIPAFTGKNSQPTSRCRVISTLFDQSLFHDAMPLDIQDQNNTPFAPQDSPIPFVPGGTVSVRCQIALGSAEQCAPRSKSTVRMMVSEFNELKAKLFGRTTCQVSEGSQKPYKLLLLFLFYCRGTRCHGGDHLK